MTNKVILAIEDLSKTYIGDGFKVNALNNISFKLHKGEMIAIMGTSGSGKSTLLNILGALDKPTVGSIKLKGEYIKDIFLEPFASLYRQENIGFIFQSFNLLKDLTVAENISLPLILRKTETREITQKVNEIMDILGLTKWENHRPTQLSGGQQQRVAIGRAIITSPPIVLADEPTGNLDFNTSIEILNILVNMKKKLNQSILIVTHDANVATFADRVLFFHDGRIVDEYICEKNDSLNDILEKFKKITERKEI